MNKPPEYEDDEFVINMPQIPNDTNTIIITKKEKLPSIYLV
jgi:hypothetical protein